MSRCSGQLPLPIKADPRLRPVEKHVSIEIHGNSHLASLHANQPSAIRGLLAQPEFQVQEFETLVIHSETCITGVRGLLPVSCIKIGAPRKEHQLCRLFSRRSRRRQQVALCSGDTDSTSSVDPNARRAP